MCDRSAMEWEYRYTYLVMAATGADTPKMAEKRNSSCSELKFASLCTYNPQIMLSGFTNTRLIYKYFYSPDLQLHPVSYSSHPQSCIHSSVGRLVFIAHFFLLLVQCLLRSVQSRELTEYNLLHCIVGDTVLLQSLETRPPSRACSIVH